MNHLITLLLAALLALSCLDGRAADINFFPPAPEAKSVIDWDKEGFTIQGQRTFITSGSIHYARVPRDLWRDRLLRLKRGGFTAVQTYVFWNFHEPTEDSFDFTGEKDLDAFLTLAQQVGLYATVRVGPYDCAEWNFGGYPLWLKFKPGMHVRDMTPAYQKYQDAWLAKILPIVAAHQVNKGGNVIFVQLENEGSFWGAWTPDHPNNDPYYQKLYHAAIDNGIQVPFFMSGMHHGFKPQPDDTNSADRYNPWYATEVWSGWYDIYGTDRQDIYGQISGFMTRALAFGANGFNYYMAYGGTNFGYWNNNEDDATYDYGGPIGQAGDLRPLYYRSKRYNTFASSFADILEQATGDLPHYRDFAGNGIVLGVRKSPVGTIVFVQGSSTLSQPVTLKGVDGATGASLSLPNHDVAGIVLDAPLVPAPGDIRIAEAATQIFGIAHHGASTTLVAFGHPGDTGELTLNVRGQKKQIDLAYADGAPKEIIEPAGAQTLRILVESTALEPYTWIVGPKGRECVVVGPEYVGDFAENNGKPTMDIERFYGHDAPSAALVYGDATAPVMALAVTADKSIDAAPAPTLAPWQIAPMAAETQPSFDDSKWFQSDDPKELGADGDDSAYGWYRAVIQSPAAGSGTLHFPGAADHLLVYVNGKPVTATPSEIVTRYSDNETLRDGKLSWSAPVDLQAGANSLAVFVMHEGRDKAVGYSGQITNYYPKGIFRPVSVEMNSQTIPVTGWKMHGGLPSVASLAFQAPASDYAPTTPAFFATTFTAKPPGATGANPMLRFDAAGLSRGSLFLNGHNVGRYPDVVKFRDKPVPLYLPECWFSPDGNNSLVVFDEKGRLPAQAGLVVETATSRECISLAQPADPSAEFTAPAYKFPDMKNNNGDMLVDKPAIASSSSPDSAPYFVNDDTDETTWYPAALPTPDHPEWVEFDLGEVRPFKVVEAGWSCPVSHVAYRFEGSNDGNNWSTLVEQTTSDNGKDDAWKLLSVPSGTSARYLRLTITGVKGEPNVGVMGIHMRN